MTSFSCKFQLNELCQKVRGAYCRPGMRGCVVHGLVEFHDGVVPYPVWPPGADPSEKAEAEEALKKDPRSRR